MNHSNDPLILKNVASVKYSKYYHHRKYPQEPDFKKKDFDNFDSFAKEAIPMPPKAKNVGKIRRNSCSSNLQQQKIGNENLPGERAVDKWANDELISKIRCSQIVNQPQKSPLTILKDSNISAVSEKLGFKRNTRSVSSHYETSYTNMVKEYQKKKEKINHEIEALRKTQPIKVERFYQTSHINHNIETPKFGSHFTQSQKKIISKTVFKANKDPKCAQFLNGIKVQIGLQERLRNLKHQISKSQQQTIRKLLKQKYGIEQDITAIDSEQFDPFAEVKHMNAETMSSQLADSYLAADQNWNKNIKNNFQQVLLNDIFTAFESENQKGTISLKSFVREIGILLQNQKYLRNRDLYRIYKRLEPFTRQNFISKLKKKE